LKESTAQLINGSNMNSKETITKQVEKQELQYLP